MDHSISGYLSRRSEEELEKIIAMYWPLRENAYYNEILTLATYHLEQKRRREDL